jgi:hypothetical protein
MYLQRPHRFGVEIRKHPLHRRAHGIHASLHGCARPERRARLCEA